MKTDDASEKSVLIPNIKLKKLLDKIESHLNWRSRQKHCLLVSDVPSDLSYKLAANQPLRVGISGNACVLLVIVPGGRFEMR